MRFGVLAMLCVLGWVTTAGAQDVVEELETSPNPGIRYVRRVLEGPTVMHAIEVDLEHDGVRVETTSREQRWQSVSEFAENNDYAVALNGGFWGAFQQPRGLHVARGERWSDDDLEFGFFAIDPHHRARISPPEEEELEPTNVAFAVSGRPSLVIDGHVDELALDSFPSARQRAPRSAVGVSRDGKHVFFVVVDGRQQHSRGASLLDVARWLVEMGADRGLNLDGGGSSALYVEERGGVVNAPSGGRWEASLGIAATSERTKTRTARDGIEEVFVRGVEREVMSHIGVIAPPPENAEPLGMRLPFEDVPAPRVIVEPPRPPMFRLGRAREIVVPALYGLAMFVPLALLARMIVRRRRVR